MSARTNTIEVFDILVSSKHRVQIFDLAQGDEFILNRDQCDYLTRMEQSSSKIQEETQEDSVYILESEEIHN
jgi:hypothetical protein